MREGAKVLARLLDAAQMETGNFTLPVDTMLACFEARGRDEFIAKLHSI